MKREQFFFSTISPDAGSEAEKYGFGIEIAEYCTAWNIDNDFSNTDARVKDELKGVKHATLHGPFNELFPCAIDPLARKLAADRFMQALELAEGYGCEKLILHGGFYDQMYYPEWFSEQSEIFWDSLMERADTKGHTSVDICVENVLEKTPELLGNIIRKVDHPRLKLCLDVGHVHAYSKIEPEEWIESYGGFLSHYHIHNNYGERDTHNHLDDGSMDMVSLLKFIADKTPETTLTLELPDITGQAEWLLENARL